LFRAPKVVQRNKCRRSAVALSRRTEQSGGPPSSTADLQGQAEPLCAGRLWWGLAEGTTLWGAALMHRQCPLTTAPCHPGQRAAQKCHFLAKKAQEKNELALSREQRCLHSTLTSAGKYIPFINSLKRQLKHYRNYPSEQRDR